MHLAPQYLKFKIKRPATKTALGDKKATRSYLENYLSSIVIFFPFVSAWVLFSYEYF